MVCGPLIAMTPSWEEHRPLSTGSVVVVRGLVALRHVGPGSNWGPHIARWIPTSGPPEKPTDLIFNVRLL